MAIPTTSFSAQLLLVLAFLLLGIWSSTFKMAGSRWRFELFSFDFAVGGLVFALLASYTLGSAGADLGFSENLMLASRTNQALAVGAGCLFALGNMLLLAAIALLGLSFAYALSTASALLILAAIEYNSERILFLGVAIVAALLAIVVEAIAVGKGGATLPAVSLPLVVRKSASGRILKTKAAKGGMKNSSKGVIAAILAGLALGGAFSPFRVSVFSQYSLGPYAGVVLFAVGVLVATLFLNVYFMNLSVQGGTIGLSAYFSGTVGQHLLGIAGGALCSAGILLLSLPPAFPAEFQPASSTLSVVALGAGVLAFLLGLAAWRELARAPGGVMRSALLGALFLVVGIGIFALAMEKSVLPPQTPLPFGLSQAQLPG